MKEIPEAYKDLRAVAGPRVIVEARKLFGVTETPGTGNNSAILAWADEVGGWEAGYYDKDSIPWCGLFVGVVVLRAGFGKTAKYLSALAWAAYGVATKTPGLGDILVFTRDGGGHVGFYVGEDDTHYHVLGGNQSDTVCIVRIKKSRLYAARTHKWKVAKPDEVRPIRRNASGATTSVKEN